MLNQSAFSLFRGGFPGDFPRKFKLGAYYAIPRVKLTEPKPHLFPFGAVYSCLAYI